MAYLYVPEKRRLYLLTPTESHKFRNLRRQPAVSLLIDTRDESPRHSVAALTVSGEAGVVEEPMERGHMLRLMLEKHPQLRCFDNRPDVAVVEVTPHSYQLLQGIEEAFYHKVDPGSVDA
jgi:nitroimidazol reductase NimA-like FMN-containing flavoprotein (pyridoxamine 5'-phosphate oxidase superfamily)